MTCGKRKARHSLKRRMIFEDFCKKNFNLSISQWCSNLPEKSSAAIIVLYVVLNLFVPQCFSSLILRLTVAPWSALLLVCLYLCAVPGKLGKSCAFKKLEQGSAVKVSSVLFLVLLLCFISHYWSCEFFKFLGIAVKEKQYLAESLKNATVPEIIVIGVTTIIFAPIGEEIVFRRMLYGVLFPLGAVKALFLCSFFFSIAHFYLVGIIGLFFLALLLHLLYFNTRNIWCPIQVHMIFNALSFVSVLADKN